MKNLKYQDISLILSIFVSLNKQYAPGVDKDRQIISELSNFFTHLEYG